MQNLPKKPSGFTLIELLIAITIIAILSTIGFSTFTTVQRQARDSKRMQDLSEIQKALEQYKVIHGSYRAVAGGSTTVSSTTWLNSYFQNNAPPTDPNPARTNYEYKYFSCITFGIIYYILFNSF